MVHSSQDDCYFGHAGVAGGAAFPVGSDLTGDWAAGKMPVQDLGAAAFGQSHRLSTDPSLWQPRDWIGASPDRVIASGKALTEEVRSDLARCECALRAWVSLQDFREIDRGFLGAGRAATTNGGFVQSHQQSPYNTPAQPAPGSASDGFSRLSSDQLTGSFSPPQFSNDGSTVMARRNGGLGSGWELLPAHAPNGGLGGYGTTDVNSAALWSFGSPGRVQEQSMWGGSTVGQQTPAPQDMAHTWADASMQRNAVEGDYGLGGVHMSLGLDGGSDGNGLHHHLIRQPSAPAVPSSRQIPLYTNSMPYLHLQQQHQQQQQQQQQEQQPQQLMGEYSVNGGISGTASDPEVLGRQLASLGLMSSDALLPAVGFEEQQRQQHLIHLQLLAKQPPAMDVQHLQQGRPPASPGLGMHGGSSNGVDGGSYGHLLANGGGLDVNLLRREGSVLALPVRTLSDPSRVAISSQQMQVLTPCWSCANAGLCASPDEATSSSTSLLHPSLGAIAGGTHARQHCSDGCAGPNVMLLCCCAEAAVPAAAAAGDAAQPAADPAADADGQAAAAHRDRAV